MSVHENTRYIICNNIAKRMYYKWFNLFLVHRKRSKEVVPNCNNTVNYDDDLRLYNDTDFSGILQIYNEDEWGNVCFDQFTMIEGQIACRQLGFSALGKIKRTEWYYKSFVHNNVLDM